MNGRSLLLTTCLALFAFPAWAQYGVGETVDVPYVPPGAITVDGVADESIWDLAAMFDPVRVPDWWTDFQPDPDLSAEARVLWSEDTLYIYVHVYDNEIYVPPLEDLWRSDQIVVGIDPTHAGDSLYASDFSGWPPHAPDKGPYSYKVYPGEGSVGFTLDWNYGNPDTYGDAVILSEMGWVNGVVFVDQDNLEWGFEMAAYVPQIDAGDDPSQIGFNIGGAQASQAAVDAGVEDAYGYYSHYVCDSGVVTDPDATCSYAGGAVMSDSRSFATLNLVGGGGGTGEYGVAETVDVPYVPAGAIMIDGVADESIWDLAAEFDPVRVPSWWTDFQPDVDMTATARVLWTEDTLYIFAHVFDNEIYVPEDPDALWRSDQLVVGLDPTHAGDSVYASDFSGWPPHAPDKGPYAYKIHATAGTESFTLNWNSSNPDTYGDSVIVSEEGWVNGVVFVDDENLEWGFEMAAYIPQIDAGGDPSQIGFNIGGAQASQAAVDAGVEDAYGYFSHYVCEISGAYCTYAGGAVMSDSRSFATLNLVGGGGGSGEYGVGETVEVPRAPNGSITIDGVPDEAIWQEGAAFDPVRVPSWWTDFQPDVDMSAQTRVLWTEDTLYVYTHVFDNEIFVPEDPDALWRSDQIEVGIDPTHAGDSVYASDFSGWPPHAPDKGPYAYKIHATAGRESFTLNWNSSNPDTYGDSVIVSEEGWVNGVVFVDEDNLEWGFEMAAYVPQIDDNAGKSSAPSMIGFNIGGAQASQAAVDAGVEDAYGYFSHYVCEISGAYCTYAGGAVMSDARSFATLLLVETVNPAVEDEPIAGVPEQFMLSQNYPNPFNPTTTIEYGLKSPARATVDVFNVYGQRITRLVDAQKAAGSYRLTWDAENLPSGMYVYQLRVDGSLVSSKTMTLIK